MELSFSRPEEVKCWVKPRSSLICSLLGSPLTALRSLRALRLLVANLISLDDVRERSLLPDVLYDVSCGTFHCENEIAALFKGLNNSGKVLEGTFGYHCGRQRSCIVSPERHSLCAIGLVGV